MTATHGWHTRQLHYVAALPEAPVERELYMEVPRGVLLEGVKNTRDYVLQLKKNLYGQKQAGWVWNQYLIKKLKRIGFKQSEIDKLLFHRGKTMYLFYTDDSLLAGPDQTRNGLNNQRCEGNWPRHHSRRRQSRFPRCKY